MSVLRGTATDFLDLVDKLDSFLTSKGHAWGRTYTGTGNGRLVGADGSEGGYIGGADSVAETFTLEAVNATTFTVTGTVSGALANATVGTAYTTPRLSFRIDAGATPFVAGDTFTINTTAPWQRLVRRGVSDASRRTAVNFTNVQDAYTTSLSNQATGTGLPAELRLEFVWPDQVGEYVVTCTTTTTGPRDFTLDYSDNGTAWTTADTRTGITWSSNNQARTFQVPAGAGAHRFWRLRITASNSATLNVRQFQLRNSAADNYNLEAGAFTAWKAPGADGVQEICIGLALYIDTTQDVYNLRWYGSRFWDVTRSPATQANTSGQRVQSAYNSPMPFTFIANGHRLIPVVKVGTYYNAAYLGFRRSYDPPSADPWPCVIAGNHNVEARGWSNALPDYRNFWNPSRGSTAAHLPSGAWLEVSNVWNNSGDSNESSSAYPGKMYPSTLSIGTAYRFNFARENLDGSYTLIPCAILSDSPRHAAGELDGVYWVSGFNNTAENVVTRDGFAHLCFPNVNRTTAGDFAAIRLD